MEDMRIYFAGSIRAGRADSGIYAKIVEYLKTRGTVLTEHVSNDEMIENEKTMTDIEIYEKDISYLRKSHVLIAEVTVPSLGVGYELAFAEKLEVPVLCLHRLDESRVSAMITGDKYFVVKKYETIDDAKREIDSFLINNSLLP